MYDYLRTSIVLDIAANVNALNMKGNPPLDNARDQLDVSNNKKYYNIVRMLTLAAQAKRNK